MITNVLDSLEALKLDPCNIGVLHRLVEYLHVLLQDGLAGNRAIGSGDVWAVVVAATRAFPIQLSPSVEKAQEVVASGSVDADLLHTWVLQAAADGTLAVLLQKLCSQPQILTAYSRSAAIRQPAVMTQLTAALQELQSLIPASPYDNLLAAKAAAGPSRPAAAAPAVHIETELDLLQQGPQHQQPVLQQSQLPSPASSNAGSHNSSSSGSSNAASSTSGDGTVSSKLSMASSSTVDRLQPPNQQQQQQQQQQQGLMGRLRSARLPQIGSFSRKAASQVTNQPQDQQPGSKTEQQTDQFLQLQLLVTQSCDGTTVDDRLVHVSILPLQQAPCNHQQQEQQHTLRPVAGKTNSNSSKAVSQHQAGAAASAHSSGRLQRGGESVRALLQGLQQSAASGLQQSAAATASAGQDISGAVAAAGGAVAAAMSSPFVTVRGLAGLRGGGSQQRPAGPQASKGTSSSSSTAGVPAASTPAAAAGGVNQVGNVPGGKLTSTKKRQAAKDRASSVGHAAAVAGPVGAASGSTAMQSGTAAAGEPLVRVQLQVTGGADASGCGPVRLQLQLVAPVAAAAAAAAAAAGASDSWSTRVLLGRLRLSRNTAGSSSSSRCASQQQEAQAATGDITQSSQQQQQQQQAGDAADLLEGDMWSVMSRLKSASSMLAPKALDGAADTQQHAAAADTAAAEASAAQLQASAAVLQEQIVAACDAVCAAAAASKGALGEECGALLQLVALVKGLLNHGLHSNDSSSEAAGGLSPGAGGGSGSRRSSTPEPGGSSGVSAAVRAAGSARELLGGLLEGRRTTAFGVLQALHHGSKGAPRLMLGADGIATMRAARAASPAAKLDMWVRASINQALLATRLSTLAANPVALTPWYLHHALLLQHERMAVICQALVQLSQHRFALPVEAGVLPAGSDAGAADRSATAAAGSSGGEGPINAASSKGGSVAAALNPKKLLGGLSAGLGTLRMGSASSATAAAPAPPSSSSTSTSASIPTYLWGVTGAAQGPAAAEPPAAPLPHPSSAASSSSSSNTTAAAASGGGFLRRRRVPQIQELRVAAPGSSGAVLSREPSSTLSPMSTEGDAACAEWWSPNNSSQDLSAALAAAADGGGGSSAATAGQGGGRRLGSSGSLGSYGSGQASLQGSGSCAALTDLVSGTPRSPRAAAAAAAAAGAGLLRPASRQSRADSDASSGATSEAALRLEQELTAAMSAPLLVEQLSSRRSSAGSGAGSSRGADAGVQGGQSAGWEAAVAAARARSKASGLSGHRSGAGAAGLVVLSRRSRSPEPQPCSRPERGAGTGSSSGSGRRPRHMHKRSSSLNDLPELEALWLEGG